MRIAVVDYGSGNLHSVMQSLKAAGQSAGPDHDVFLTDQADDVLAADRLVLPGVGAFADCARNLRAVDGMIAALEEKVLVQATPFLGICVGMQLMADAGHEDGLTKGLGWIKGEVRAMAPTALNQQDGDGQELKIPHMGWNSLTIRHHHPVMAGLSDGDAVYFVHSYHFTGGEDEAMIADVDYGGPVVAAIARDNMVGVQFHPEKSQHIGQGLLTNWLNWKP